MLNYSLDDYVSYSYRENAVSSGGSELPVNVYAPRIENAFNGTAVVCIHGGAWTSSLKTGEKWQGSWMRHHASILASLGYYALEITHRSIETTSIGGVISDVETVFKTVKNVIMPRHGIEKMYAIGDSAGGHLALMSAIFEDKAIRPEKVIACNPVSDLTEKKWQLGTTTDAQRREASPLYRTDKTDTEIFILHGESDKTVPIDFSYKLKAHLDAVGNKCVFEALPEASHAFILYGYTTPIEKVNEYMGKALNYLD